jgi:uncharacterized damage-inducible protein DinB
VKLAVLHLYDHNDWANSKLIEFLEAQPAELLVKTAPGSYGSIAETLVHLVAAQERYIDRISGEKRADQVKESDGWPGFELLRESLAWSAPRLVGLAAVTPDDVFRVVEWQGQPTKIRLATVLAQAINHATEHRVNITTILSAEGVDHPDLDVWAYPEDR